MKKIFLVATLVLGLAGTALAEGLTKADWDYLGQLGVKQNSYTIKKANSRPDAAKILDTLHRKINASYSSADAKATAVNNYLDAIALTLPSEAVPDI